MKGDKRKAKKEAIKGAKKAAEFKKYTEEESMKDRQIFFRNKTAGIVKEADLMLTLTRNLSYHKAVIEYRQMMEMMHKSDEKHFFIEDFDGTRKVKSVFLAELNISMRAFNQMLHEYTRTREKFVKEHGFTDEQVLLMLNEKFNWSGWQEEEFERLTKKDKDDQRKAEEELEENRKLIKEKVSEDKITD